MTTERIMVREKLDKNHLTGVWLIDQLAKRGIMTDKSELSSTLNGSRKGPKIEKIIQTALAILEEYERNMSPDSA